MQKKNITLDDLAVRIDRLAQVFSKRFDGVDKRFDGVDKRFDGVDKRLDGMDKRFDGVDKRLISLDKKIETEIESLAVMVNNGFQEQGEKFDRLEKQVLHHTFQLTETVHHSDHRKLEERVSVLEKKVFSSR